MASTTRRKAGKQPESKAKAKAKACAIAPLLDAENAAVLAASGQIKNWMLPLKDVMSSCHRLFYVILLMQKLLLIPLLL